MQGRGMDALSIGETDLRFVEDPFFHSEDQFIEGRPSGRVVRSKSVSCFQDSVFHVRQ